MNSRFNEKVLAGAVKELNEKTSQNVEYAPIKEGRVVVGVRFFMQPRGHDSEIFPVEEDIRY